MAAPSAHNTNCNSYNPSHESANQQTNHPINQPINYTIETMTIHNFRPLGRHNANFVFRNNRLLIGWRNSGVLRSEAWLGVISEEEAAGDHTTNDRTTTATQTTTTDWLRVYTSPDGSEEMYNGVMGIDQAHPSILHPHVDNTAVPSFLELGATERLKLAEDRLAGVKNGRWKFCKHDGGKLEWFHGGEHKAEQTREKNAETGIPKSRGEKRSRGDRSPELPRVVKKLPSEKFAVCGKQVGGGSENDGEDGVPTQDEKPAESGSTITRQFAPRSTKFDDEVEKSLSPSFDGLKTTDTAVKDEKEPEQKKPPTLMELAEALRDDLIRLAGTLSKPAKEHRVDLTEHFAALSLADSVEEILGLSRTVLVRINYFRRVLTIDYMGKRELLKAAEAQKKPEDIVAVHKQMVLKYKFDEDNARMIWMDLKTRTEDLHTRLVMEQLG